MLSISRLFDIARDASEYDIREVKEDYKYLNLDSIPFMNPPDTGSNLFDKDLEDVMYHMKNPCLGTGFLDLSHDSVEDIFKKYSIIFFQTI